MRSGSRLLQLTDTHLFADPAQALRGVVTRDSLMWVLAAVREEPQWPPDAVLVTGDVTEVPSEAAYRQFVELLGPLGVPVYCIPGNHDEPALMRSVLVEPPFSMAPAFELPGWIVVLLSSHVPGKISGAVNEAQLERMDRLLARDPSRHALVALHHPPVAVTSRWLDRHRLVDGEAFLARVAQHPNARVVLYGHIHQDYDAIRDGLRLLATPSTCSQFLPGSDLFATDDNPPAWRWLTLHADGQFDTQLRWLEPV